MPYGMMDEAAMAGMRANKAVVFRSEPYTGGLVSRYAPQFLQNNQASRLINADLDDITRPKLRDGYKILGDSTSEMEDGLSAGLLAKRIAGFGFLHTATGTKLFFIAIDNGGSGKCYYRTNVSTGGSWAEALVSAASFAVNTTDAIVFQANDGLVVIPDSGTTPHVLNSSGTLFAGSGGTSNLNPPTGCVDGCYMLNRVWLLKQGTASAPPTLHYSKILPAISADWNAQFNQDGSSVSTTIAGRLQLSPNNGGQAIAVRPWNETSLMAFFNNCIEEILVYSSQPQGGSIRRLIETRWGCGSRGSVVALGQQMVFMDQFGSVRTLQQTVAAEQAGVSGLPLSDPIGDELPGRLNKAHISKVQSVIFKDKLYVAYPRDGDTECYHVAVFSIARGFWESIWKLRHPVGKWVISNIRGSGDELWFSDASTATADISPKLYRFYSETWLDNGTIIVYEESSKALDWEAPECDKVLHSAEVEVNGDGGATAIVSIQANENGHEEEFEDPILVNINGVTSFPLTSSSFQLDAVDFPLVDAVPSVQQFKFRGAETGDNWSRGRTLRLTIRTTSLGKRFERMGYRLMAHVQPYEET